VADEGEDAMTLRERADPYLAALRAGARGIDGPQRAEVERARFSLYAALEGGDADLARAWLATLRTAVAALGEGERVREHLSAALDRLDALVGGAPPPRDVADIALRVLDSLEDPDTRRALEYGARERGVTLNQLVAAALSEAISAHLAKELDELLRDGEGDVDA
jgi:hypothetical protein